MSAINSESNSRVFQIVSFDLIPILCSFNFGELWIWNTGKGNSSTLTSIKYYNEKSIYKAINKNEKN